MQGQSNCNINKKKNDETIKNQNKEIHQYEQCMKSLENKLGWLDAYYAGFRRQKINFNGHNFTNEVRKLEVRCVYFSSLSIFIKNQIIFLIKDFAKYEYLKGELIEDQKSLNLIKRNHRVERINVQAKIIKNQKQLIQCLNSFVAKMYQKIEEIK